MPGLLTHLVTSFIGFFAVWWLLKDYRYGLAFVVGQVIPDTIKFGVTGLIYHTTNFYKILAHPIYWTLNEYTHTICTWALFSIGLVVLVYIFYKIKWVSKNSFIKWAIADLCFIASIAIHLLLDALIIESSYWI